MSRKRTEVGEISETGGEIVPVARAADEDGEVITKDGFRRRGKDKYRQVCEQAEQDGDPRFDYMVSSEYKEAHPDIDFCWAPQDMVREMTGKARGYERIRGATLANGVVFNEGELVESGNLVLLGVDRERKQRRAANELKANNEWRGQMLKKNTRETTTFVGRD